MKIGKPATLQVASDLKQLEEHRQVVARSVSKVMSAPVLAVSAGAVLGDVLTTMLRTGVRHLAVVDTNGACRGVVADRAVVAAWAADPDALVHTVVGRILDPRPPVVGADATIRDVARVMYIDGIDAVAVIDRSGRATGIVTASDLIAIMATTQIPVDDEHTARPRNERRIYKGGLQCDS